MKVVPFKKTAEGRQQGLDRCAVWNKAKIAKQPFLYVSKITEDEGYPEVMLNHNRRQGCGDYFLASDFDDYEEIKAKGPREFTDSERGLELGELSGEFQGFDKHGNIMCSCGSVTNIHYVAVPNLICWDCGALIFTSQSKTIYEIIHWFNKNALV